MLSVKERGWESNQEGGRESSIYTDPRVWLLLCFSAHSPLMQLYISHRPGHTGANMVLYQDTGSLTDATDLLWLAPGSTHQAETQSILSLMYQVYNWHTTTSLVCYPTEVGGCAWLTLSARSWTVQLQHNSQKGHKLHRAGQTLDVLGWPYFSTHSKGSVTLSSLYVLCAALVRLV